jgi:PKD repeat protein
VNATDNNGCVVSSGPINIVTGSAVAVPVEPAVAAICDGVPATITAGAGFTGYTWSNGASGQAITVSNTGFYSVTATDDNGCPGSSALVEVISSQFPISNFSYTQNEGGYTVNFENLSQNGLEYVWAFDSVGTSPLNNPSFTFPDYGPYTVTLIISNPCGSDTINKLVVVTPVGIDEISSGGSYVLSPNPTDNIAYIKKMSEENEEVNIQLFDASGRLLFKENNVQTSKSSSYALQTHELNAGVYLVLIQSKRENNLLKLIKK